MSKTWKKTDRIIQLGKYNQGKEGWLFMINKTHQYDVYVALTDEWTAISQQMISGLPAGSHPLYKDWTGCSQLTISTKLVNKCRV